jgi:hypothetical protein
LARSSGERASPKGRAHVEGAAERDELTQLWDEAFPAADHVAGNPEHFAEPEMLLCGRLDGVLVSVVCVSTRSVIVGAHTVQIEVGAVGGVATRLSRRGFGHQALPMVLTLGSLVWPAGEIDLNGLPF